MRRTLLIAVTALLCASPAQAKLYYHHSPHASRSTIHRSQIRNLAHSRYVCAHGAHANRIWHCKAVVWLEREAAETAPPVNDWVSKQIAAATWIGANSGADPWPNCPDPIWNGASSWQDTANCENGGNWFDSPGFYRCGLQFDPAWELRFGRLCP